MPTTQVREREREREIMLTAAMKMVVWPLRWPLLHLATRVHARLRSASAATQVRGRERERERSC